MSDVEGSWSGLVWSGLFGWGGDSPARARRAKKLGPCGVGPTLALRQGHTPMGWCGLGIVYIREFSVPGMSVLAWLWKKAKVLL